MKRKGMQQLKFKVLSWTIALFFRTVSLMQMLLKHKKLLLNVRPVLIRKEKVCFLILKIMEKRRNQSIRFKIFEMRFHYLMGMTIMILCWCFRSHPHIKHWVNLQWKFFVFRQHLRLQKEFFLQMDFFFVNTEHQCQRKCFRC